MTFENYREKVEARLEELLPECETSRVREAMRYSLLGGKMVRGVFTLAFADMLGGATADTLDAACALEMVHAYSLIHDDLPCMDNGAMRRGKPSCHVKYGEYTALLAGDGLLTDAFGVLSRLSEPAFSAGCTRVLADAAGSDGMIYGQELDLGAENSEKTEKELRELDAHKTGKLFEACALLAEASIAHPAKAAAARDFASQIGFVFQIVDDILDVTANDDELGKKTGSDHASGKTTYVTLFGVAGAKRRAESLTGEAEKTLKDAYGEKAAFLCEQAEALLHRIK